MAVTDGGTIAADLVSVRGTRAVPAAQTAKMLLDLKLHQVEQDRRLSQTARTALAVPARDAADSRNDVGDRVGAKRKLGAAPVVQKPAQLAEVVASRPASEGSAKPAGVKQDRTFTN
ncbi:MAG: hypothetical protein K2Q32_04695 [Alphaproteobacteria bacterium]|nr:hypothetical protein [Alphaproteobacteria bacterium]